MLRPMLFLLLSLLLLLSGCKVEMYSGLSEDQANQMLSTLLRRGIEAEKQAAGKNGYTLLVDDDQLVRALQVLKENSLPREAFKNLGEVFAGDGMISSTSEVQARMSYALSQELADTLSRIDGVLTARVHVVLGVNDKVNNITIAPSAAVFLRHTLDSPVVNFVPEIRELVADCPVFDKITFSCWQNDAIREAVIASGRKTVIICGIESHVCALQTVIDLCADGYQVLFVEDCVDSRKDSDKATALRRAEKEGAILTSYEALLFELTHIAGNERFNKISALVK